MPKIRYNRVGTKTKLKIMENWTNTFGGFINKLTQRKKLFDLHHQDGETVEGNIYYEDSLLAEEHISICKYDLCKFLGLEVCKYYGDVTVIEMHDTFNFHDGYDQEELHTYLGDYEFEHRDILDYLTEKNLL